MITVTPLRFVGAGKQFGRLAVLRGIDLVVQAGEVVGLLGANGCGKTTLLSAAAGLLPLSHGARTYGEGLDELDQAARAGLAFVAHSTQLYQRLTARENLALWLSLAAPQAPTTAAALIDELLGRVGLLAAADRVVSTFSRGMQQRLAIARALLGRPQLLLLDEPFTALDYPGRAMLATVLRAECERGAGILLSSHDLDAVTDVCDRVVLLADGRIMAEAIRSAGSSSDGHSFAERIRHMGQNLTPQPC